MVGPGESGLGSHQYIEVDMRSTTARWFSSSALAAALLAVMLFFLLPPQPPKPSDPDVAALGERFDGNIASIGDLAVTSRGALKRDRDTFFWSLFTDQFGSNPNTPYMWNALPLLGFLLPSPMWNLRRRDAVVLLSRLPPQVEYFSFTTFALWMPRRGLPFSSLGDSVNNLNIKHSEDGLFAHVVTADRRTFASVERALVDSGLPAAAINLVAPPSDVGLFDEWTHFETVLRLFRFQNQTDGDAYLRAHPPVFYLRASHGGEEDHAPLPEPAYKARAHPDNVNEAPHEADFAAYGRATLSRVGRTFEMSRRLEDAPPPPVVFAPLMIRGLECLKHRTEVGSSVVRFPTRAMCGSDPSSFSLGQKATNAPPRRSRVPRRLPGRGVLRPAHPRGQRPRRDAVAARRARRAARRHARQPPPAQRVDVRNVVVVLVSSGGTRAVL